MSTTMQAVYEEGVLKLRRLLPLPPRSEVIVTVEMPAEAGPSTATVVVWPDISARLTALYGSKLLAENAVLGARNEERY
jgi:predicted DNA-binding antitoxin AbrB/MazE fold protein